MKNPKKYSFMTRNNQQSFDLLTIFEQHVTSTHPRCFRDSFGRDMCCKRQVVACRAEVTAATKIWARVASSTYGSTPSSCTIVMQGRRCPHRQRLVGAVEELSLVEQDSSLSRVGLVFVDNNECECTSEFIVSRKRKACMMWEGKEGKIHPTISQKRQKHHTELWSGGGLEDGGSQKLAAQWIAWFDDRW